MQEQIVPVDRQPDEVESFLRILIRRKAWFLSVFFVVLSVGCGWAILSAPVFNMNFKYLMPVVAGYERPLLPEDFVTGLLEIECRRVNSDIGSDEEGPAPPQKAPEFTITAEGPLLSFSMPTTEANAKTTLGLEKGLIQFLDEIYEVERARRIEEIVAGLADLEPEIEAIGRQSQAGDFDEPVRMRLEVLTKRSIELHAAKSSLGRIADGILLEGPSLEGKPVGISRSVKLILALFVSTLLAVLGAISAEYAVRATRPI
ncbi:MAG: hypothetical protein O3A19_03795 [Planctomycetota bacterium]|nr:hypothetical protein [Planctomycetota bacterium]